MPQFTGNRFGFGSPNAPSGPGVDPISASGGTKTTSGDQTIHTFTGPGDFIVSSGADNCNCLLYTSPSPRDVEESRMPSSA